MEALLVSILVGAVLASDHEIFVSPSGDDTAPGTHAAPLRTLDAAQLVVRRRRAVQGDDAGAIIVHLGAGDYVRNRPLALDARDGGTGIAPVIWQPVEGATVRILGGPRIDPGQLADGAGPIRRLDLRTVGIDRLDPMLPRGMMHPVRPAPIEVFADGEPLTLARWPNAIPATTVRVSEDGLAMRNFGPRAAQWVDAPDAWLYGHWQHDGADESIPLAGVDPETGTVTFAYPPRHGLAAQRPFRVENVLAELDARGEYYVDRERLVLHVWPPEDASEFRLSLLAEPLVTIDGAAYVRFERITFACSRGDAIAITNGDNIVIAGCDFTNLGNRAIVVDGGERVAIQSCDIWNTGEGGVVLAGGDRATLTPSYHGVANCDIHHYNRRTSADRPAIRMHGVAQAATNNRLHDVPHAAIIFAGNDHAIWQNEIHDVLTATRDGGAIACSGDWTMRGTAIRGNYFHDIRGLSGAEGAASAVAVDDQASGITIAGNVFVACRGGVLLGGGRDLTVEGNVFVDCDRAVRLDARGLGAASDAYATLVERLNAVPYRDAAWSRRYPDLAGILEDEPMSPRRNVLHANVLVRSGRIDDWIAPAARAFAIIATNMHTDDDPGFVDAAARNFMLREDSRVWTEVPTFELISFDTVGMIGDVYRPELWDFGD